MKPVIVKSPTRYLQHFQDQMNKMLEETLGDYNLLEFDGEKLGNVFRPNIEMSEKDNKYIVKAQLPGLTKDEIDVNITDEGIMISGEYKRTEESKEENFHKSEFKYGKFIRNLVFPTEVNADEVVAHFKNGILIVEIQKKEDAKIKQKHIDIIEG